MSTITSDLDLTVFEDLTVDETLTALANAADPSEHSYLIDMAMERFESLHCTIAAALCHQFANDRSTLADEIAQCVRIAAWRLLKQVAGQPEYLAQIRSYRAVLTARASRDTTDLIDSTQGRSQSRGEVSLRRRLAEASRTREDLIREGITNPTNEQIIERTNARMNASRSDAARQGMLLKEDDFKHTLGRASIADYDTPAVSPEEGYDAGLYPGEAEAMITTIMRALREADASRARNESYTSLEEVGQRWFAQAITDLERFDRTPTADALARELGIPLTTVKAKIAGVRRIAQSVAAQYASITGLPQPPAPAPLTPEPAAAEVVEIRRFGTDSAPLPTAA